MEKVTKKPLPVQNLVIEISSDSDMPVVTLNGIDFKSKKIGLKGLQIIWGRKGEEPSETLIQVDYSQLDDEGNFREVSVCQSFAGSLLQK